MSFLRAATADVRSCPRLQDKLALAVGRGGRVFTYAVNALLGRNAVNPHLFLYKDITMHTDAGIFHCRRRTNDFGAVSVTHEPTFVPYFDVRQGVFIDVGANIGKYTVMVGRQFGANGTVVAIEADPDNYAALCRNIALNRLRNVIPVHAACGADTKEVVLYRHPWGPGLPTTDLRRARERAYASEFTSSVTVKGVALDGLLDELGIADVALIKIDVEYAELAVLQGAIRTIDRNPRLRIVVEATSQAVLSFLTDRGFCLIRVGYEDHVAERSGRS